MTIRNKYININDKINFVNLKTYINARTYKDMNLLKEKVKRQLYKNKGTIINNSTGFKAKITNITINKILHPTSHFKAFNTRYIDNLNAAYYLDLLFKNAIYVDTLKPMKQKATNINEIGYHHFVAPLKMNGQCYKAIITVKERINSKTLYVVSVNLFMFNYAKKDISAKELIDNINIWNYDLQSYNHYSYNDFVTEDVEYNYLWLIA